MKNQPESSSHFERSSTFPTDEKVLSIIGDLRQLEARTRPGADDGHQGQPSILDSKDQDARQALELVGNLVRRVAGWAIDHKTGLVLNGMEAGAPSRLDALDDSGLAEEARAASDHRHEVAGASYQFNNSALDRRVVATLLRHNPGAFPPTLAQQMWAALYALDYGEVFSIFERTPSGKHGPAFTLDNLRLWAALHFEFMRGLGRKREPAITAIAHAYGFEDRRTIERWMADAPRTFPVFDDRGSAKKKQVRADGKRVKEIREHPSPSEEALREAERLEGRFGEPGLRLHGDMYKAKGSDEPAN